MSHDFYGALNLLLSSTHKEIKKRYYELAKVHHPDKVRSDRPFILKMELIEAHTDQFGSDRFHPHPASLGDSEGR